MGEYGPRHPPPVGGWSPIQAIRRARQEADWAQRRVLARQENAVRLAEGRVRRGRVNLRFCPYVQTGRTDRGSYEALRGHTLKVAVPEVLDAYELLRDLLRFLRGWRPMRVRTDPQQVATKEVFEQWDRLAAAVRDSRWA